MWQRWVSTEWKDAGFYEVAYEMRVTERTTTADGVTLCEVGGHYLRESDYPKTRAEAMRENYEELRKRLAKLTNQCEALRQEIEKEGDA